METFEHLHLCMQFIILSFTYIYNYFARIILQQYIFYLRVQNYKKNGAKILFILYFVYLITIYPSRYNKVGINSLEIILSAGKFNARMAKQIFNKHLHLRKNIIIRILINKTLNVRMDLFILLYIYYGKAQ